jgi:hypothetical protein
MATEAAFSGDDPHGLLATARQLSLRVRKDHRATWFPLLVFAALTFAAIPVRRYSGHYMTCRDMSPGRICTVYTNADLVYWPIALVLAYVAIVAFYIHRSRARGIGTRVRPYAVAGIVIAVVLSAIASWELHHPLSDGLLYRLASPGTAIGVALLVLVWAERNRILLVLALAYLAVVLVPVTFGPTGFDAPWYSVPVVSQGSLLLAAGIGFAVTQRPLRTPAP